MEKVWIDDIQNQLPDALIVLIGNKCDIDEGKLKRKDHNTETPKRKVKYEDGQAFANKHNLHYFKEVSAKTGEGISDVVEYIVKSLYQRYEENLREY